MGKLDGGDGALGLDAFAVEAHEVVDAQAVDIGIIGNALLRDCA